MSESQVILQAETDQIQASRQALLRSVQSVSHATFEDIALQVFRFQVAHNVTYREYVSLRNIDPNSVRSLIDIPYLPVSAFKFRAVKTGEFQAKEIFQSSGTTGNTTSRHFVRDPEWYKANTLGCWMDVMGQSLHKHAVFGLFPGYGKHGTSSLIYMTEFFAQACGESISFITSTDMNELIRRIKQAKADNLQPVLIGVTHALLKLAAEHPTEFSGLILIETGGMKGQGPELTRTEVHTILQEAFKLEAIYSEYGMTELLSQAYSKGDGIFELPKTMHISIRDVLLRDQEVAANKNGAIHVIDLANIDSCAFIALDDLGRKYDDGRFEVLGRIDHSDTRGCNLMTF